MSEQGPPQDRFFVGSHELIDKSERPDEPAFNELPFGGMNQTNRGYEYYLPASLRDEEPQPDSMDEPERPDEPAFNHLLFGGMNQTNRGYEYYLQASRRHLEPQPESMDEPERPDELAFNHLLFGGMNQYYLQANLRHLELQPESMDESDESTDESDESMDESDESTDESERPDAPASNPTTSRRTTRRMARTTRGAAAGRAATAGRGAAASKKTHKCTKCKKKFNDKIVHALHKLEHRRAEVPEGRRLYCNFPGCEFFTAHKNGLEYHVKTHKSEKDFICKTCGYSCIVKSMLESHEKRHTDKRPFECERCGYATKFRSLLNKHMKTKHGKVRTKSETGARGRAQNNRQDTDVDTVDLNIANDGVRPNFFHALYGQPFPSLQHSSPSTSSSALSSPAQPRSFSPVPYSPTFGIRSPAPSNPTMPPNLSFFQFPPHPSLLTSPPMLLNPAPLPPDSLFPFFQFPPHPSLLTSPPMPLNPAPLPPDFLLSFRSSLHFSSPPPAHTKPAEPPSCLNSTLPSPPPAHQNPSPRHPSLDLGLFPLPFP